MPRTSVTMMPRGVQSVRDTTTAARPLPEGAGEILDVALTVFPEHGDRGTSFQEIADRIGLTQPALLHYFGSREELLLATLQRRDELGSAIAASTPDPIVAAAESLRHNLRQPGIMRLYAALAGAATDPAHRAHDFFTDRYRTISASITEKLWPTSPARWSYQSNTGSHLNIPSRPGSTIARPSRDGQSPMPRGTDCPHTM